MDHVEAAHRFAEVAADLYAAGYIVTGELSLCIPLVKICGVVAELNQNPDGASVVKFRAKRLSDVEAARREPLPSIATSITSVGGSGVVQSPPESLGYTGETCVICGGVRMQRAGTCAVCLDCGATGGCS